MAELGALAALGLAANVVEFIGVALKIYKSAYDSFDGLSQEYQSTSQLAETLRDHAETLADGAHKGLPNPNGGEGEGDERIVEIANQCQKIARDLLEVIQKYEVHGDVRFRHIALARKAVRGAWNRSKIQEMEALLEKYHKQLVSYTIFSYRPKLDELSKDARETATNTLVMLERSQKQHEAMSDGFRDMNVSFQDVTAKLDNLHAILSRPSSPVPPYTSVDENNSLGVPGATSAYPSIIGPGGRLEIQGMPLHDAAFKGDVRGIRKALSQQGVHVNAEDGDGSTALHISVMLGDVTFTRGLLMENELNVDAIDHERKTPLHYAVKGNSPELIDMLLERGAKGSIADIDGRLAEAYAASGTLTAWLMQKGGDEAAKGKALLHFAKLNDLKAVQDLLQIGAKANVQDSNGFTALIHASVAGNASLIKAICAHQRSVINMKNKEERTALISAAIHGRLEAVRELLSYKPDLEAKDKQDGRTALFNALVHAYGDDFTDPHWTIATVLAEAGANIETTDSNHFRPLMWFSKTAKYSAVRWLLENGAQLNAQKRKTECNALMETAISVYSGACKTMELLLDHGADTEIWNKAEGCTALYQSARRGYLNQARLLIERGANVNTMSKEAKTPLWRACWSGHTEVVKLLLESGAYVHTRDHMDRTAINSASQNSHTDCVELLLQYGARPSVQNHNHWSPLHEAAHRDLQKMLAMLLRHGAKVDLQTDDGETPLLKAAKLRSSRCVEMLLEQGASVSIKKCNGWTPLDEASTRGITRTMGLLIEAGADVNNRSRRAGVDGWSPLMHAAEEGRTAACKMLVAAGADIHLRNSKGETAYQIAKKYPNVQDFLGSVDLGPGPPKGSSI